MDVSDRFRVSLRAAGPLAFAALSFLVGCSLVRSSGDFSVGDAGTPEGTPCVTVADCPERPNAVYACTDGVCAFTGCEDGYDDCNGSLEDGCEADIEASLPDCGGCGMACELSNAVGACEAGTCALDACMAGFADCDADASNGCEADLGAASSCGTCGNVCADGELCDSTGATPGASPVCSDTCSGTVCGDSCVDTTNSVTHCGGCDMACGTTNVETVTCEASECAVQACLAGFGDCDGDGRNGCEASLDDDPNSCGACGVVCGAGTLCVAGVCDPVDQGSGSLANSCVVRRSGEVWCWGRNQHGQSNPETRPRRPEMPMRVLESLAPGAPPLRARAVSTGPNFTCVIGVDDRLRCWGYAALGSVGAGSTPTREDIPVLVTSADAGFASRTFVKLVTGETHNCAIDDIGGVWCWGQNNRGQVGQPASMGNASSAVRVPLAQRAVDVALSVASTCAVLMDGTVRCWGDGRRGELGDGLQTSSESPVTVSGISTAQRIVSDYQSFCVIDAAGGLQCWGTNITGALGPRVPIDFEASPITVESSGVLEAWMPLYTLCWRKSDGVRCAGSNRYGQFGDGMRAPITQNGEPPVRVPALDGVRGFFAGRYHACGIEDGRLSCWGGSFEGTVPRSSTYLETAEPVVDDAGVVARDFDDVSMGSTHGCGIRLGALHCWGSAEWTKTGQPFSEPHAAQVPGLIGVESVAAGREITCAIVNGGPPAGRQVFCWGNNDRQQSAGTARNNPTPILQDIPGGEEIQVSANEDHTCAIQESAPGSGQGTVWCWGANFAGQLGRDTGGADAGPGMVAGLTDVVQVTVGHAFTCALRAGGTVECWGQNAIAQLGDGTTTDRITPAPVSGLTNVEQIDAGYVHACARQTTGNLVCWGSGGVGQLGDGRTGVTARTAVLVSTSGFSARATSVAAGDLQTCATYDDGNTRCWGWNVYSSVGGPGVAMVTTPQVVPGVTGGTRALVGGTSAHTSCALQADRSVVCWGADTRGATGAGNPIYFAPTPVVLP